MIAFVSCAAVSRSVIAHQSKCVSFAKHDVVRHQSRAATVKMMIDPEIARLPTTLLSEAPAWLPVAQVACGPLLALFNLIMLVRIPLSWYPKTEASVPWIYLVATTEWLLKPTRKVIPPQGGVDVSSVVWLAIGLFLNEILNGPQGVLVLLQNK